MNGTVQPIKAMLVLPQKTQKMHKFDHIKLLPYEVLHLFPDGPCPFFWPGILHPAGISKQGGNGTLKLWKCTDGTKEPTWENLDHQKTQKIGVKNFQKKICETTT